MTKPQSPIITAFSPLPGCRWDTVAIALGS